MKAFERPSFEIRRRIKHVLASSSNTSSFSSNQSLAFGLSSNEKYAIISALSAPLRTADASARSPIHRLSASMAIDLPAPVSPVTAVIPDSNAILTSLTTAKFLTER